MQGRGGGWCVGAMQMEWQVVGCGQPANKGGVFLGGLADAVMYVDHGKYDAELVAAPRASGAAGRRSRRPPETATATRWPG